MMSRAAFLLVFTAILFSLVYGEIYRLPKHVKPVHYHLTMEPHLRDLVDMWEPTAFNGSAAITIKIFESTRNITLHSRLHIDESSISVVSSTGVHEKVGATFVNEHDQTYTVQLEKELAQGEYIFTIGSFNNTLGGGEGFFRAYYAINDTTQRALAATHFEPTGARLAFPCFDEPSFKATFVVSLIRKADYSSVSNEALKETEDLGDGRFKDTFKQTPIMSTFTLAFAVTDFKYTEKLERHRILARLEVIENGEMKFALDVANRTLIALEEYMRIKFVIDKMDQIAIPTGYFHEHAMENWGLVVYGEEHLIRNNESTVLEYKRTVCYIAHEFAHQWFGNLVTPAWWEYLWLAESFAAYFQYHIADEVEPSWRLKEQFLHDIVHKAFTAEEEMGEYPLDAVIEYPGQYPPFHIMYEKGSSIVRMMEHILTHDVFKRGLQIYLQKNKFSNARPSDLYAALQEAVNKAGTEKELGGMTVAQIMKSWEDNAGYPILTVTRDYKTGSVTFKQSDRFAYKNQSFNTWTVPINYVFSATGKLNFDKTTADYWLNETEATLNDGFPTDGWLIVNKQQTGYYRVNYDLENWERIIRALKSDDLGSIHVLSRSQLISDAFSLAKMGELPWEIALKLGEYAVREKDYIALSPLYYALSHVVYIFDYVGSGFGLPADQEFTFFKNYTLINDISIVNRTEFDVYKEYVKATIGGFWDSFGKEIKPGASHIDQLHHRKLEQFSQIFA